jgi:lauroyl/myristoyl acyltransferase
MAKAIDLREYSKRVVPLRYIDSVVERRVGRLWDNEQYRAMQELQMRYLLEHTERADEVPDLARKFAEYALMRTYLRWHPAPVRHQPVRDIEWLTTRRDPDRSIILNFMHHGLYEGLFTSLRNAGAPITILGTPKLLGSETPTGLKQHMKLVREGNPYITATGGLDHIQAKVRPGMTMAIASDVPGRTEVTFLGRRVLSSFGAALIASNTNSQVVIATARRDDDGNGYIQIHEPLEPKSFTEPMDLLHEMLRQHGEAVLAWPEAVDMPRARWGIVEE